MIDEELQQLDELKNSLMIWLAEKGAALLVAVIIVFLGFWLGKNFAKLILKVCDKRSIDVTLARFFAGFTKICIIAFAVIMALSKLQIEITPFIALLGAGAFGLSLAVQGPVSNYGAGIVLIVTRPFKVGDTLTLNDLTGRVDCVNLGTTELINEDEERITIPNRSVLGEIFINSYKHSIVEAVVGIDYSADPEAAIRCISDAIQAVKGIASERIPEVGIDEFADSSINIGYRVWVPTSKYHRTRFAINMAVFRALEAAKIAIPFPQRDVHLIKAESENG
ncbi:MAG: small conductance mechanosensitive channel [Lentimonas sp.]|jgi:small conductance mechanosensitive channel